MKGGLMFDVIWLTLAVIVGLLHLGITTMMAQRYRPSDWGVGPRDTPMPSQGTAARMERAYHNFTETFPLFAAALLAVVMQSKSGGLSHVGAILYVVARVVYIPLYAFGVAYFRSLAWVIATIGIVLLVIAAL
jgi:uncharacterized MAPEG superfamily protein